MEDAMTHSTSLPPITLTAADRDRLAPLAQANLNQFGAEYLAREVERAQIVQTAEEKQGFVKMGSWVKFRDDLTGKSRLVTLVYPDEASVGDGKLSVLTPIGAALVGLSRNQSIDWETSGGELRSLTVLDVEGADASE
jgi:regulator of nucleoside diphosphate kinase